MSTDNTSATEPKKLSVSPLKSRKIRPIFNLHEWFQLFEKAGTLTEMVSLIHEIFDVDVHNRCHNEPEYEEIDRIIACLSLADGRLNSKILRGEGDDTFSVRLREIGWKRNTVRSQELKQKVAAKAFSVLCTNFFKVEMIVPGSLTGKWVGWIEGGKLIPALQHFFRLENDGFGRISMPNIDLYYKSRHEEAVTINLLLNLGKFLWEWNAEISWSRPEAEKQKKDEANAKFQATLDEIKPWMLEVLWFMDKLEILRKYILRFKKEDLDKLKELALRQEVKMDPHSIERDRRVKTVDEAYLYDCDAARLLVEHQKKTDEIKRQERIKRLQKRARKNAEAAEKAQAQLTKIQS